MQKTNVIIYNGTCDRGRKIIKKLLSDNKTVICLDKPSKFYDMQDFLRFDNFIYYSIVPNSSIDLGIRIDEIIFIE